MGIEFAACRSSLIYRDPCAGGVRKNERSHVGDGIALPALTQRLVPSELRGRRYPTCPTRSGGWPTLETCENTMVIGTHVSPTPASELCYSSWSFSGSEPCPILRLPPHPYCFSFSRAKLSGTNCCATRESADVSSARHDVPEMKPTYVSARLVVLAVGLHPVQPQRVQERGKTLKRGDQPLPARPIIITTHDPQGRRTSMTHRIEIVSTSHITPTKASAIIPTTPDIPSTLAKVMSHSTSDS